MEDYRRYKWFFTSSGKLVMGGKSAAQNDHLLKGMKSTKEDFIVMHTKAPGSPFSIIVAPISKVTEKDLEECAVFTGCFSRAWKENKKTADVDFFKLNQVSKKKGMKEGTWGVSGKVEGFNVDLKLALITQKKILRAVPELTVNNKEVFALICPGKTDKTEMAVKILEKIKNNKIKKDNVLAALPAGGVRIC